MTKIYKLSWPGATEKIYVGKTSRPLSVRLAEHMRPRRWKGVLGRAIAKYGRPVMTVLEVCEPGEANERERFWIAALSRVPAGYNILEGGEGGPMPLSVRRAISERSLVYWQSAEGRQKASVRALAVWATPERRRAHAEYLARPGVRENLAEKAALVGASSAAKESRRAKLRERWSDPNQSAQHSEAVRKGMTEPGARSRYEARLTPEVRKKLSDGNRSAWGRLSPEERSQRVEASKKAKLTPEVRLKMSQAKRAHWEARRAAGTLSHEAYEKAKKEAGE